MKKTWKLLSALLMTIALVVAMAMTPAGAAEKSYSGLIATPTKPSISFDKYLVMETSTAVPNTTFTFTLSSVAADDTLKTMAGILDGVKYDGSASTTNQVTCSFVPGSTVYTSVQTGDGLTLAAGWKYAKASMTLDFSGVEFTEPGIYAYKLTESLAGTGSAALTGTDRYLYVYVVDATTKDATGEINKLDIAGYLLTTAGDSLDEANKSKGFTNQYPACTLTFGKEVTGNQGSRDKFFKFTVKVTGDNISNNDLFNVDMTNAVKSPAGNSATAYTATVMETANNVTTLTGKQLKDGYDFYLQDGNYISIIGIPEHYNYEITEVAEEYTGTATITAANSSLDWDTAADGADALADAASGNDISADIHTGYTNDKTGTIPTGVLMSVGPVVIVGLIITGGIVVLGVRNAKRKAMEAAEADSDIEE